MHNFELMAFTTEYQLPLNDTITLTLRKFTKSDATEESAYVGSWNAKVNLGNTLSSEQDFYILNSGELISCDICREFPSLLAIGGGFFETPVSAFERVSALADELSSTNIDEIIESSKELANRLLESSHAELVHIFPELPNELASNVEYLDDEPHTFFFVAYPCGDRSRATVIDVSYLCSYERGEYDAIDDNNFKTAPAAIEYAKAFVKLNGLRYEPFDSRYSSDFSEV